jgi:hypothetical protein
VPAPPIKYPAAQAAPKPKSPKPLTDHERLNRVVKTTQIASHLDQMWKDINSQVSDLEQAAEDIGNAYSDAVSLHKAAVAKQKELDALEAQLMFSILTVLTSGALSWMTEFVQLGHDVAAASGMAAIDKQMAQARLYYSPGIIAALEHTTVKLKDNLTRQLSRAHVWTTVVSDTLVAMAGEAFASMGPYLVSQTGDGKSPPSPAGPADMDPDRFRGSLKSQIHKMATPALMSLKTLQDKVTGLTDKLDDPDTPWELWENFDNMNAKLAYQEFKRQADELAGSKDLPDVKTMTDDMEKYIWALWVPRLHRKEWGWSTPGGPGGGMVIRDAYDRLRAPIDDRLVALHIETEDQTDDDRETEDKRLIKWSEGYLRELQPWVTGKKQQ